MDARQGRTDEDTLGTIWDFVIFSTVLSTLKNATSVREAYSA